MYYNEKHAELVNNRGDNYIYIGSYLKGDILNNGNVAKESYIRVKCPYCKIEYDVRKQGFKRGNKCDYCCNEYEKSFAYHIEVELQEPLNKYWDWEKNAVNPYYIYKNSKYKVWIKCTKTDYHDSYEVSCINFGKGKRCPYCANRKIHLKDSFAQYHIDNTDEKFLEKYWSDKNTLNPWELSPNTLKKIWIKCQEKDYHEDYETSCDNFTKGERCPQCCCFQGNVHPKDSFAQYHIDNTDKDFLKKYWSDKNTLDPWKISPQSNKKIWIKCQEKDYHEDYLVSCFNFYKGSRCSYCNGKSASKLESFGIKHQDKIKYWSNKNKKTPYEVLPNSNKKYWFICQSCGKNFKRSVQNISISHCVMCNECNSSSLELKVASVLDKFNIEYDTQKKFNNLIGLGKGKLSYDFYMPKYNILLECQGEQHEHFCEGMHRGKYDFKRQQEHDRRKFNYALEHNYIPMEIWYWDYDNIEEILIRELDLF